MMECQVCNNAVEGKYKCVQCYLRFCSVTCGRIHKDSTECRPQIREPQVQIEDDTQYRTQDTIFPACLEKLGESSELKELLKCEDLRRTIIAVDGASDGGEAVRQAMTDEAFSKFVDICLPIVSPHTKP